MSLAMKLKKLRAKEKKSLQEVADAVGSSKGHIYDLETGKASNPTFELLNKLAKLYKVSVSYLSGEEADKEDEDAKVLFRGFKELTEKDKKAVQALVDALQPDDEQPDED